MLRIAVQSKGRLYDETMMLLEEAGIKLNRGKRILLLSAKGFPVEVLFLRDDDIPQSVANGVADIGIVGENEYVEKGQEARLIKRLGFLYVLVLSDNTNIRHTVSYRLRNIIITKE